MAGLISVIKHFSSTYLFTNMSGCGWKYGSMCLCMCDVHKEVLF